VDRTERLLKATAVGIDSELEELKPLIGKFENLKMPRGKSANGYEPHFSIEKMPDEDIFSVEMDDRIAALLKKIMSYWHKETKDLRLHHNSIMMVYVWASFETYIFMLFEEIFTRKPEMLKSSESISYKTAIENKSNIVQYLIQNELEKIGHFSLEEHLKYLDKKINLVFSETIQDRLRKIYLIRNIIAHNTGIVASRLKNLLPKSIKLSNGELQITTAYLTSEMKFIQSVVLKIEKHVDGKINKNES